MRFVTASPEKILKISFEISVLVIVIWVAFTNLEFCKCKRFEQESIVKFTQSDFTISRSIFKNTTFINTIFSALAIIPLR